MIDIIDQCFFNFSIDDSDCHGSPQIALFPMLYSPKHLPCLESSHAKICPYPGYRMTLDVFTRSCQDFDEISDSFHWAAVLTSLLWCFERGSSCLVLTCQKVKVGYIQLDTEIVLKIQLKKKKHVPAKPDSADLLLDKIQSSGNLFLLCRVERDKLSPR